MSKIKKHNITIIGSGFVGMILAIKIARQGIKVTLVDKSNKESLSNIKDSRTTAISQGSSRILKEIGLWSKISEKSQPIKNIIVTEGISKDEINFNSGDLSEGVLGYIVDNKYLKKIIFDEIVKLPSINFRENILIQNIIHQNEMVKLETNKGSIFSSVIIGADGRYSKTRFLADIKYYFHNYNQVAYVFNVTHSKPHKSLALERFFPSGPLALLPMKSRMNNKSSVVWTIKNLNKKTVGDLEKNFKKEFAKKYNDFFGRLTSFSQPNKYDLNVFSCYEPFKNRVVLIGDANQAIHPIAGQGLNLGLRDSNFLADSIIEAHKLGLDIGSEIVLRKYSRKRFFDKRLLFQATHTLNKIFSNQNHFLKITRKIGLRFFNKSNFLKKQSMLFAMGLKNY